MNKELVEVEIIELVTRLSDKASYFEAIVELAKAERIPEQIAWRKIEQERERIGLKPMYKTANSFRVSKSIFYKTIK